MLIVIIICSLVVITINIWDIESNYQNTDNNKLAQGEIIYSLLALNNKALAVGVNRKISFYTHCKDAITIFHSINAHNGKVLSMINNHGYNYNENFISGSDDGTIKFWDVQYRLVNTINNVSCVRPLLLNSCEQNGIIAGTKIWSYRNGKYLNTLLFKISSDPSYFTSLAMYDYFIISGCKDGSIKSWLYSVYGYRIFTNAT
jgi:WD40 repeat protein